MSAKQQQALDALYAIDNVLTINIVMPSGDWDAVRTEQPAGGVCNFEWTGGSRFTWRKATSVEISETHFPVRTTVTNVGVKKKPLGYTLLGMAGLPHSRCNLARVLVNGKLVGQGVGGVNGTGVDVNAEPIMKHYIEKELQRQHAGQPVRTRTP